MVRGSALRLNGEETEISLAGSDSEQLFSARYVKTCLAAADPGAPVFCFLRLIRMDGVEINDDELINRETLEEGQLHYVLLKMDAKCDQKQLPVLAMDPEECFDPRLILTVAHKIWVENDRDASAESLCRYFCVAWKEAVMRLPHADANETICEETWLSKLLKLVWEVAETEDCRGYCWEGQFITYLGDDFIDLAHDTVGKTAIQFVKEKLEAGTVEQAFETENDLKDILWKLIRQDDGLRGHPSLGGLRFGLGAELMLQLIEKGLPRWVWASPVGEFDDNLLQHILVPVKHGPLCDHGKTLAESKLCIALAERFNLEEFCHHNSAEGQNALCLAADFAFNLQDAVENKSFFWRHLVDDVAPWRQVHEAIQQQMKERIKEFDGSLPLHQGEFLVEDGLWEQAAMIRKEWLRMGWRFACTTIDEQICEVVSWYFQT